MSEMFQFLDLETISVCNRKCVTCIRNSHPNKTAIDSWFARTLLPESVIEQALDQFADLPINKILEKIINEVNSFQEDQLDDMTLVIFKKLL